MDKRPISSGEKNQVKTGKVSNPIAPPTTGPTEKAKTLRAFKPLLQDKNQPGFGFFALLLLLTKAYTKLQYINEHM